MTKGHYKNTDATQKMRAAPLSFGATESRKATFLVISGSQAGRLFSVAQRPLTIGRSPEASIHFDEPSVSRVHAQLELTSDGRVILKDLQSTNGTFCNGVPVAAVHELKDGDKIQVGSSIMLKFSYQDTIEAEFQQRQYESATVDALTGCYNRSYFNAQLTPEFTFASRNNRLLAMVLIDLDYFKRINDTYGHPVGDQVLQSFGRAMRSSCRANDIAARYGGEEFAMLMREISSARAVSIVDRIRASFSRHSIVAEGETLEVTFSAGIAVYDGRDATPEALVKRADNNLYEAKRRGRNCVVDDE